MSPQPLLHHDSTLAALMPEAWRARLQRRRPGAAPVTTVAAAAAEAARVRLLAQQLQAAREDERARLARDLHDELGALLTAAKLDSARLKVRLADAHPQTLACLAHLVTMLDEVISLKRRIIEELRPSALDQLGLVVALEIAAHEFGQCAGIPVHCTLAPVTLSPAAQLVVYRLVQESLNNIAKHAGAKQVWLHLAERDGRVEAAVRDDGRGFDPWDVAPSSCGLLGMRLRAQAEGGAVTVHSTPGCGTRIRVSLPCSASGAELAGPPGR